MALQVGGVRADSMASQMVHFPSSMILPEPGRTFTVGSMTWVIGANSIEEIMEAVQKHLALILPHLQRHLQSRHLVAGLGDPSTTTI